jgi:general secretion pathway protein K
LVRRPHLKGGTNLTVTPNESSAELSAFNPSQRDDGFVLVFVLGMLALLAVVAAGLMASAHLQTKARRALNAGLELTAAADGVTRLVAYRLGEQRNGARLPVPFAVDGRLMECGFGSAFASFRVQDQAGLVDLNAAPLGQLVRLLQMVDAATPSRLAAAIVDFRDADDVALPGGAEATDYRRAGFLHGPKNAPFEAVEELDQVLGMTPATFARLRAVVTVHGEAELNAAVAPDALRTVFALAPAGAGPTGAQIRPGARGRARIFGIEVQVRRGNEAANRSAIVEFSEAAPSGFLIRSWFTGDRGTDAVPEGPKRPCDQL